MNPFVEIEKGGYTDRQGDDKPDTDMSIAKPIREENAGVISLNDYDKLSYEDWIIYDTRSFWRYFVDMLYSHHIIFSMFRRSLVTPFYIRAFLFTFVVTSEFGFNAFFYFDNYIYDKGIADKESRVSLYNLEKLLLSIL